MVIHSQVNRKKPLWMTGKVLRTVKKKKLWKKWRECNEDRVKLQYKKQATKASKAVRMTKRDFERKIAKNIKSFFKYPKSKSGIKPSVGPLIDDNRMLVRHGQDMSDLLNTFLPLFSPQ